MKTKRGYRLPIIISLIVTLMAIIAYALNFSTPQNEIECYEEIVASMTIQEVSNLLDVSLVELTWLPSDVQTIPVVTTYPSSYQGNAAYSRCNVTIDYPHPDTGVTVSIRPRSFNHIEPTKMPVSCSWNFSVSGPTGSHCSFDLHGTHTTVKLQVSISPDLSPETILQILDGMIVVEPSN